ncbi:MAG: hypothetical protein AAGI53_05745 [Planctomycetota bacterium]
MTRVLPDRLHQSRPGRLPRRLAVRTVDADSPALDSIVIRFELGRRALRRVDHTIAAKAARPPELRFEFRRTDRGWSADAVLFDDASGVRRTVDRASDAKWSLDTASDLWHVELPMLRATIELTEAAARVLYAATPLPNALGLQGGRYEVVDLETR